MNQDKEIFKIVVIGSRSTGKTKFLKRYTQNEFDELDNSTMGVVDS